MGVVESAQPRTGSADGDRPTLLVRKTAAYLEEVTHEGGKPQDTPVRPTGPTWTCVR